MRLLHTFVASLSELAGLILFNNQSSYVVLQRLKLDFKKLNFCLFLIKNFVTISNESFNEQPLFFQCYLAPGCSINAILTILGLDWLTFLFFQGLGLIVFADHR